MLKSGIYDFVICRGGTDMCFVLGFGRKRPDLKQYRISGLTHTEWEHQHGRKLRRTHNTYTSSASPIWKTLWKMQVPVKVQIHCWRALLGAIPCLGILANQHMISSS